MELKKRIWLLTIAGFLVFVWGAQAVAAIQGITGTTFNLDAKTDYIMTSDGDSYLMWGYSVSGARAQYPGPTLIVNQGAVVTVNLTNSLAVNTSIVFPGQKVTASLGVAGLLTQEATPNGGTVRYTFTADQPGTFLYRSGSQADLQVEMGLVGALIVRPAGYNADTNKIAYNHSDSQYDREFLYLLTEMDPVIHAKVATGQPVDMTTRFPTNWFINGRNWPDVMADNFVPWLPTQPYNCQPRMHPGEKVLLRCIGAGVDIHPMHFHGNDFDVIAEDGRLLSSRQPDLATAGADLSYKGVTRRFLPGKTTDAIWTWTGEELGFDIYGHAPGDPLEPGEYAPDHGVPFPVVIPPRDSLTFGPLYSGSPFLGGSGDLPAGHAGLNAGGGFFYMWHSHTEKELTSNDLWPGGLVSFMIVEPPSVPIQ